MSNSYTPTEWIPNRTIATADVMNNMEEGILNAHQKVDELDLKVKGKANKIKVTPKDFSENDEIQDHSEVLTSLLNTNKSILLDNKEYRVSKRLNYKGDICIDGNNATITPSSEIGVGDEVSRITSKNNVSISNLTFKGNTTIGNDKDGVHVFDVVDSSNILIDKCTFKDNKYVGSRYFNCNNVKIMNSNFENTDCGILTLGDTANNFFISNCHFNGHDLSEPISFYSSKSMNNININNCTIENKATMSILLGQQRESLESVVDGFNISNIITKNVLRGILFNKCKNGTVTNFTFNKGDSYGDQLFSFNRAENIKVSNCICTGSKLISIFIGEYSKNINLSDITLIEPGGGSGEESKSRFFELYGSNCSLKDIKCISTTDLCDKNIYVFGNNNILSNINGFKCGSEYMRIYLQSDSTNNTIINPIGFDVVDKTLNYNTSTTNRVVRNDWKYESSALSNLTYKVYNKFFCINYDKANWDINKISLYAEGESIQYVIQNKYYTDMTLTLGGDDSNIIFKNTDIITLKPDEVIQFEFVVRNNKWVEISR